MPALVQLTIALAILGSSDLAAAQKPIVQLDGTMNVGATQTTQGSFQADPNSEEGDIPSSSSTRFFTEIRPGIAIQTGKPRLLWRIGYLFSANFGLEGDVSTAYSNQGDIGVVAQLTKFTVLTLSSSVAQGSTAFLLSQRAADTGEPEIRAPGNPSTLSSTLGETLTVELSPRLRFSQTLTGATSAPQDDLEDYSASLIGSLALDRPYKVSSFGMEVRASVSRLQPLRPDLPPYESYTTALLARWSRDFSWRTNARVTAGIEQVFTDAGSQPLAFQPTGTLSVAYNVRNMIGALEASHGTTTNVQVGTISITDRITARGVMSLNLEKQRALSFSAGALHNEPLGEASLLVAAGTGNAIQADAGFITAINKHFLATARYTASYQFDQGAGLPNSLSHIFLVGVTARYTNAQETLRPLPRRSRRVDGTDGQLFPVDEEIQQAQ